MAVKVKDVMRKYVVTVDPNFTLDAVAKILSNNKIGSVVIVSESRPIGIVTSEDIVASVALGKSPKDTKAHDLTSRPFVTASPEEKLENITKTMITKGIKRIPIVKDNKLEGIVTDKEILVTAPQMVNLLSEKLKARVERVAHPDKELSGICERCEGYSDNLHSRAGRWLCEDCRE